MADGRPQKSQPGTPGDEAVTGMTNGQLAALLGEIAELLEIRGDSTFKVQAYRRAADSVARASADVAPAYAEGRPPVLPGVGRAIAAHLAELATTGRLDYLAGLRREVPPSLRALLAIPGVGPRTAGEVWRSLGVATLADLEAAARTGRLRSVRGISERIETRILDGLTQAAQRPTHRMLMGRAQALGEAISELALALPGARSVSLAGSLRRGSETVGDIDVVLETTRPAEAIEGLRSSGNVDPAAGVGGPAGRERVTVSWWDGTAVDLMTTPPGRAGTYLVHLTGSAEHNVRLRQRARQLGWSLSEHALTRLGPDGTPLPEGQEESRTFATEAELYAFLGLELVPPELREDRGEVEAAEAGTLPHLVSRGDLQGDCHSHSDWSDGREPLETMVESARRLGMAYLVLTDHSQSLTIAKGLSPERVEQQRRVIGALNERFAREEAAGEAPEEGHPEGFRLLHGCELEITVDGRLDYEAELLSRFDVVVASLHVGRRQPRSRLMARYEVALRSPHVDIIAHPSGRKIGTRPDLDLDWEGFYRLAAETRTLLEVNGSEERLDLDEHRARAALEAGCRFTIDSDAHDRGEWQNLRWGTSIARRGWLARRHVANTLTRERFLALFHGSGMDAFLRDDPLPGSRSG
ncbi:DNA polymerase/3'-5' exonuclease PolX [soil metagenome]